MQSLVNSLLGYDLAAVTDQYFASAVDVFFLILAAYFLISVLHTFFDYLCSR